LETRVVVTGMGAVTPLGNDVPTTWDGLVAGRCGVGRITLFDAEAMGISVTIAAEVKDLDPDEILGRRAARRSDRFTVFAVVAAREAVQHAAIELDDDVKLRAGVVVGTGIGGVSSLLNNHDTFTASGPRRVSPFMVPMMMPNAASAAVSIDLQVKGPNMCVATACATGTNAIGEAGEMIRRGVADVMICGGSEAVIVPVSLAAFANMGALSTRNDEPTRASRPFDANRDGFIVGEGGGVVVLESLEHAQRRGAHIHAELVGYGATSDAFHITAPDENGAGAAEAMRLAISGMEPEQVDYINAHGTSTILNDAMESKAIRQVFGDHADSLAISSIKSMTGHLVGAAGAVEAIACVKSLETGWVPPTINYETPDPKCDLDYVPNEAKKLDPQIVISNSFGFGGHNGCLAFRRWEE